MTLVFHTLPFSVDCHAPSFLVNNVQRIIFCLLLKFLGLHLIGYVILQKILRTSNFARIQFSLKFVTLARNFRQMVRWRLHVR